MLCLSAKQLLEIEAKKFSDMHYFVPLSSTDCQWCRMKHIKNSLLWDWTAKRHCHETGLIKPENSRFVSIPNGTVVKFPLWEGEGVECISMGETNTVVSAYIMYWRLQKLSYFQN